MKCRSRFQGSVKESLKGAEVAGAVLEHIRHNDVLVMEAFDKVNRLCGKSEEKRERDERG